MRFRRSHILPATLIAAALAVPAASGADGTISTVAGTVPGFAGDGGPAADALLSSPRGTAVAADGALLVADTANHRIRRVAPDGIITTVASEGQGFDGDGGRAAVALLDTPSAVAATADGGYLIADTGNDRIRRVGPDGIISTVAGSAPGLAGDGGPAVFARLDAPQGVAVTADGGYLIADTGNDRIRRVGPDGIISTVAGGAPGLAGDGGPATQARLSAPRGVRAEPGGGFLISDTGNARVRRVSPAGVITTVAGSAAGLAGDGGLATAAAFQGPADAIPLANGGLLVADTGNNRIRRVTPLGIAFTVAGSRAGLGGDGGPAAAGLLNGPDGLAAAPGGGVLVADAGNSRVRRISDLGTVPGPSLGASLGVDPAGGDVTVRQAGQGAPIVLREPDLALNRSAVDATAGTVALTARERAGDGLATATVSKGAFTARQLARDAAVADLTLTGPVTGCAPARPGVRTTDAKRRAAPRARTRRLQIRVKGAYRTRGRYATAIARGTAWTIIDGCASTVVKVTEGSVRVRDLRRNRWVTVRAGRTYTAHARPARR
ncbi:MAG: hypothetical protein AB7V42_02480 [Thermoleophilia bacterium]